MDFINELSSESNLEFKNLSKFVKDDELWRYMFNECLQSNIEIQKSKFTFKKFSKQIRNLMKLVKVFDAMILAPERNDNCATGKDNSLCTKCSILTERIDDLQSAIQIKDIQLLELQNNVMFKAELSYSNDSDDSKKKSVVPVKRSIGKYDQELEVLFKTKVMNKDTICTESLDRQSLNTQRKDGEIRVATCMATPRYDEIHVTDRIEQTGNANCFQSKESGYVKEQTLELGKEEHFEKFVHPCSKSIDLPYASEVKQISTLTVNDSSINKTNNTDNEINGLLPLTKSRKKEVLTSPTLNYVAPILIDQSIYSNVGNISTAVADMSSDFKWPHTKANLVLEKLVQTHKSLWSQTKNDTGVFKDIEIDIEGKDPKPQSQNKLPQEAIGPVSDIVQEFLQQGILKKTRSVVNNCIWPIKNADDEYMLSVDVRALNKCITNDTPIIPDLNLMSHMDAKAKIFSVLEIANSTFSVPLTKSCQYKLAFSFNKETYAFTRLIPGLDISDGIVHESLQEVLSKFSRPECIFQHVDKFLLTTETTEEHITLLSELFSLLETAGLKLNTELVQLMRSHVIFMHMQISHGHRRLSQEKIRKVSAFPVPTSYKALHKFLNEIKCCKEFLQKYDDKVKPLFDLLREKDDVFDKWGQPQTDAFKMLKWDVQNAHSLSTIEIGPSMSVRLYTDLSENSISVTLSQLKNGKQKIIGYFSRGLTNMEKTFDAHTKQLLSLYFAVKVTEKIVRSSQIILPTSDQSLKLLLQRINSGELYDRYCPFVKTLQSKSIQVDLITEHVQQSVQKDVFRTAERGFKPVFVDDIKIHSAGYSMCYSKNIIQPKFYRKC
ncbi:uncharacterized protein LOC120924477 [Rana temporaria]|uniref:uncharacterized protein LOC120924477 n=1 Tax=Rana temporaria TaxID=8407 RepID=UPI001AAE165D|nr:uncharacterized protein LOC120924477 [Rana temporaria]